MQAAAAAAVTLPTLKRTDGRVQLLLLQGDSSKNWLQRGELPHFTTFFKHPVCSSRGSAYIDASSNVVLSGEFTMKVVGI
jgi:hypothetical protein